MNWALPGPGFMVSSTVPSFQAESPLRLLGLSCSLSVTLAGDLQGSRPLLAKSIAASDPNTL